MLLDLILRSIPPLILCYFLILKPRIIANFLGNIYWNLGRFTALGKSENTKKYFFSENTIWFKILGYVLLIFWFGCIIAQLSEKAS